MRRLPPPADQRGAAALAVTLLLLFAMTLGAAFVGRNQVFEQRASSHQYAAAQAFEAAEAGLQWAEAQLNANRRLGADCRPTTDPAADSFRERTLQPAVGTGLLTPRGGAATGCVKTAAGFTCSCPTGGPSSLARPPGDEPSPAFRIQFVASDRPGIVRVVATGCSSALPPCIDAAVGRADAVARVEVALGLIGALRSPPLALLTAGGGVDASAAVLPARGAAIRAGGPIIGTGSGPPGVRVDASLAGLAADRFFAASFGLDKAHWKAQPSVIRVACRSDCGAALSEAVRDSGTGAMVWVDGDLELPGPIVLGSTARPVLVVVEGEARLRGAVELHGALYAGSIDWSDAAAGTGAAVAGALLAERDYAGSAAVSFVDDPAALATLTRFAGSFARISGSWRDF